MQHTGAAALQPLQDLRQRATAAIPDHRLQA
jgi:hypothetical protein